MQALDLEHQGRSFRGPNLTAFRERGYTIVGGLLEAEEVQRLRSQVIETFAEMEQQGRVGTDPGKEGTIRGLDSDLLSIPSLRHVLLDPRLLRVIGELLGGEPVYFGDSSVRFGANGVRAWHRDNVDRTRRRGQDWHGFYPLLRCGLYLQDHSLHSGGLALRPHSHQSKRLLPTLPVLAGSKSGELVAWNMRTVHCGEVVRMRGMPGLALNPRVQSLLPAPMRVAEDHKRIVLFMAFGLPSSHLDNYVAYLRTRHYMQRSWSNSRFGSEVWDEAERAGLHMLRPIPAYGTPADRAPLGDHRPTRHERVTPSRELKGQRSDSVAGVVRVAEEGRVAEDVRVAEEGRIAEVLAKVREHPAVARIAHTGYSLIDFAEPSLKLEIAQLLRGWTLARVHGGAGETARDPAASPALRMGARAGLGLDPADVSYVMPIAVSEARIKQVGTRQIMRGVAVFSPQEHVRVAAVTTGKLALALDALTAADLRAAQVGVLPFPGSDRGSSVLFAVKRRRPLLVGYGPRRPGPGMAVHLPERLGLSSEEELDRALSLLVARLLADLAPKQDQAVRALGGLHHTHALRVILLANLDSSASRLLLTYARDRSLRVAVFDEYAHELRELDGDVKRLPPDRSTTEQAQDWPGPFDAAAFANALRALAA